MIKTLHERFKSELQGPVGEVFLSDMIMNQGFPKNQYGDLRERTILYLSIEELSYSVPQEGYDKSGRALSKTCFFDVVFFVGYGKAAAYHCDVFSVGVEIKSNLFDLEQDLKIPCYLGKTDYFFLAVPDGLVKDALFKVCGLEGVGVFSLTTGHIIKLAAQQEVTANARSQLLYKTLFRNTSVKRYVISREHLGSSFQVVPSPTEEDPKGCSNLVEKCLTIKSQSIMKFVGNRKPEVRIPRLELKNGKFSLWKGNDQTPEEFDYAEGKVLGIEIRHRNTKNGELAYCDFHMENGDERFDISTLASSCVAADLVAYLKNVQDPVNSLLRIDAWQNNRFTNVIMKENGRRVQRFQLPRVQKIERGFTRQIDSSERDAVVMSIIDEINAKLKN